jgi:hypothetical protein
VGSLSVPLVGSEGRSSVPLIVPVVGSGVELGLSDVVGTGQPGSGDGVVVGIGVVAGGQVGVVGVVGGGVAVDVEVDVDVTVDVEVDVDVTVDVDGGVEGMSTTGPELSGGTPMPTPGAGPGPATTPGAMGAGSMSCCWGRVGTGVLGSGCTPLA